MGTIIRTVEPAAAQLLAEAMGAATVADEDETHGPDDGALTIERVTTEPDEAGDARVVVQQHVMLTRGMEARRSGRHQVFVSGAQNGAGWWLELHRDDLKALDAVLPIYPDRTALAGAVERLGQDNRTLRERVQRLEEHNAYLERTLEQQEAARGDAPALA